MCKKSPAHNVKNSARRTCDMERFFLNRNAGCILPRRISVVIRLPVAYD